MKPNVRSELAVRGIVRETDGGTKMKRGRQRGAEIVVSSRERWEARDSDVEVQG